MPLPAKRPGAVSTKPNPAKRPKRRDHKGDFEALYPGTAEENRRATRFRFLLPSLRPISPNHQRQIDAITTCFIAFYAHLMKISEEEAAEATFVPGAPVPEIDIVKSFIHAMGTRGRSGVVNGKAGWTKKVTLSAFSNLNTARNRKYCMFFSVEYKHDVFNAIHTWSAEKEINTAVRPKPVLRPQDWVVLHSSFYNGGSGIKRGRSIIQTDAVSSTMWFLGQRPGCLLISDGYAGTNQCLTWGATELLYTGYDPAVGPTFQLILRLQFVKNMRNDDSLEIVVHTRTTSLENTHIDPCRPYIALGIYRGVWEEDVLGKYFQADDPSTTLPQRLPHLIPLKKEYTDFPVFMSADGQQPWSVSAFRAQYSKAADHNGFTRVSPYTLRTSAATNMNNAGVPESVMKYYYGHTMRSDLVNTTYQSRHRQIDIVGHLLQEESQQNDVIALRGSVAWDAFISKSLTAADHRRILLTMSYLPSKALSLAKSAREAKGKMVAAFGADAATTHPDEELVHNYIDYTQVAQTVFNEAVHIYYDQKGSTAVTSGGFTADQKTLILEAFSAPYQALQDSVVHSSAASDTVDAACSSAFDHCFLSIVKDNPTHPSRSILERMMALLCADDIEDDGECKFCVIQGKETSEAGKRNIGEHMFKCEAKLNSDMVRCNVCLTFIPRPPAASTPVLPTNDVGADIQRFNEHHEACHKHLLAEGAATAQGGKKVAKGLEPFAMVSYGEGVRRSGALHRIFCPICMYDGEHWEERHRVWFSSGELHDHLRTHWYASGKGSQLHGNYPESGIVYDLDHACEIGDCDGSITRKTGPFIEHLHRDHGIELIQCLLRHNHGDPSSRCSTTLPPDFRYHEQAKLESLHPILGRPLPDACLVERRKAPVRKTTEKIVLANVTRAKAAAAAPTVVSPTVVSPTVVSPTVVSPTVVSPVAAVAPSVVAVVSPAVSSAAPAPSAARALPEGYTIDIFGAEFNIAQPIIDKFKGMPCIDIGYSFVSFVHSEDWTAAGFTEAEYVTFTRKHAYLLDVIKAGRFTSPGDYIPPPSEFIKLSPESNLGVMPDMHAKLEAMGFALDDPLGMAKLSDDAWTKAGVVAMQRRFVLRAHQVLAGMATPFVLHAR